jgi:aromatic-L-amino-acid decarboxylase
MDADEFRRIGHELIEWVAAYREGIEARPVMSRVKPGEIRHRGRAEGSARRSRRWGPT